MGEKVANICSGFRDGDTFPLKFPSRVSIFVLFKLAANKKKKKTLLRLRPNREQYRCTGRLTGDRSFSLIVHRVISVGVNTRVPDRLFTVIIMLVRDHLPSIFARFYFTSNRGHGDRSRRAREIAANRKWSVFAGRKREFSKSPRQRRACNAKRSQRNPSS